MSLSVYVNKAVAQKGELRKEAQVSFEAFEDLPIYITKTVDRAEPVYYNGDTIIFTISITRSEGVQGAINQITLTDDLPAIVKFQQNNVEILEGTGGNIKVTGNNLTIENIVLNQGNPIFTVKITGKISLNV
jgi:uncharacterized repeat protein (TIGR01451 family)